MCSISSFELLLRCSVYLLLSYYWDAQHILFWADGRVVHISSTTQLSSLMKGCWKSTSFANSCGLGVMEVSVSGVLCGRVCVWLVCVSDVLWWFVLCGKVCVWLVCVSDVLCVSWLAARFQLHLSILLSISKNEVTRTRFMTHSDPVGPVTIKVTLVTRTRSNDSDRIR